MDASLRGAEGDKSALARQVGALIADRAKAANAVTVAADMRSQTAMHRNAAHRVVAAIAGVVACHIGDQPRRQQPHISEPAATQ